jgi:CubicO group peptidase (beta-lactamase class C family)
MADTMFTPPRSLRRRIAGTEIGNPFEHAKCDGRGDAYPRWRFGLIRGEVHDGNAWYAMHGVAGHAGLFSTARDLARYGQCWLNGGELDGVRILPGDLVTEATREQPPAGSGRGLGWQVGPVDPADLEDSGRGTGPRAYGHTGFTGTSIWMDPDADLVMILLTNRVHPTVKTDYMPIRSAFTAAVVSAVKGPVQAG